MPLGKLSTFGENYTFKDGSRRKEALELRANGLSWSAIAKQMNISKLAARLHLTPRRGEYQKALTKQQAKDLLNHLNKGGRVKEQKTEEDIYLKHRPWNVPLYKFEKV